MAGNKELGQVAGNVTDVNGNPARGAKVYYTESGREYSTLTNSSGAYVLAEVPEGDIVLRAELTQDSIRYVGANTARVFKDERTKSVNIAIIRDSQTATIFGNVRNSSGSPIEAARVFAFGGALSSNIGITDSNGNFRITTLQADRTYDISASARGYAAALSTIVLETGEQARVDFILSPASSPTLPAPNNLEAVVWTSPAEVSRSPDSAAAYDAIKSMIDPRRQQRQAATRDSFGGNPIEVDLYWDAMPGPNLLGFGIYRGTSSIGPTRAIDFLRDPEASFFADTDADLEEGIAYYYEITALSTHYPDTANSESDFSNRYGVRPIGDMEAEGYDRISKRLLWTHARDAEEYVVYVYDRYPGLNVTPIWNTVGRTITTDSVVYDGPLTGGRLYWIVVGVANGGDSLTISRISEFLPN